MGERLDNSGSEGVEWARSQYRGSCCDRRDRLISCLIR